MILEFKTEQDTINFAKKLALKLTKGDVVKLIGPLGSGKSIIARTIIQTLGTKETHIPSPTYTLVQSYEDTIIPIAHMDLYRLEHAEEIFDLDLEHYLENSITLIEWPEISEEFLPSNSITIKFEASEENSSYRKIYLHGIEI